MKLVKRLAVGKALDVVQRVKKPSLVIGRDIFAVFKRETIGKPYTKKKAFQTLKKLSGKTHEIYAGIAVIDSETMKQEVDYAETKVKFRKLSDKEIRDYINSEEVLTAAGAYRIQQKGAVLVDKIEGDYNAIVAFPVAKLAKLLRDFDYDVLCG